MTARTYRDLFDLSGKTALITGGSRGLGLQMAHAMGEAGARVVIGSRKALDLEGAVRELNNAGIDAAYIAADCSIESEARRVAHEAHAHLGEIDILVNNAGAGWGEAAEDHSIDGWDKVMNLNIRSYFVLSQEVARLSMIPRRRGHIINISSIAGLKGNPPEMQTLAYNTSKSAVIGFTQTLAGEWGRFNINVNAICPGFFKTKLADVMIATLGEDRLAAAAPLHRIGDDEDLKGVTLLLASNAGKHITGQSIAVDGGVSAVLSI
jgi:NAD(P)-dependent dehydrogenase (short-subunit alcohol dehydrogenase family)